MLTAQDRQGFRAHVTIQNKVTPEVARSTLAALSAVFTPFVDGQCINLSSTGTNCP